MDSFVFPSQFPSEPTEVLTINNWPSSPEVSTLFTDPEGRDLL